MIPLLSYEVGCLKPEARICEETVARAGCRPQERFYTDDSPTYVEGARALGIDAVQFQSLEQLLADLRSCGMVHAQIIESERTIREG